MLFIGMRKLGFTESQVGHMTLKKWNLLYKAYKLEFDRELWMDRNNKTYAMMEKEPDIDDVIPL